jgi:hypothetical protein
MGRRDKWETDKIVYKDKCFECDKQDTDIHYHHVVPHVLGGTKTIPLCVVCHGKVHNKNFLTMTELQKRGIERARQNPDKYKGRIPGTKETDEMYMTKPSTLKIKELLDKGHSVRGIIRTLKISPNSVGKVKRYFNIP